MQLQSTWRLAQAAYISELNTATDMAEWHTRLAFPPEDQPVLAKDLQGGHHRNDGQGEHGHHAIPSHLLQLPACPMHHTCPHMYSLSKEQDTVQHDISQQSTAAHSAARHSTTQYGIIWHSTAQHSTGQHSTAQHSTAQHSTAQHSTAQHSAVQLSTALLRTAQPSTGQPGPARPSPPSPAQHSTAQPSVPSLVWTEGHALIPLWVDALDDWLYIEPNLLHDSSNALSAV